MEGGTLESMMVTSPTWRGPEAYTERVFISNIKCLTPQWGLAVWANGTYTGKGDQAIYYTLDKSETTNIVSQGLVKTH